MSETVIMSLVATVGTFATAFLAWLGSRRTSENAREEAEDSFNLQSVKSASEEWRALYQEQSEAIRGLRSDMVEVQKNLRDTDTALQETRKELRETKDYVESLLRSRNALLDIAGRQLAVIKWCQGGMTEGAPEPLAPLITESERILHMTRNEVRL